METVYKIASIIAATVGRKLHTYDSWNGSSINITIENAEQLTNSVKFTGPNAWGGKSGIYVDNDCIASLILTGEAERHNTIDYCDVVTRYKLNQTAPRHNYKTMRTKTPKQIFEQWQRIARNATTRANIERVKRTTYISHRYWDNIYKANGIADRFNCNDTAKCNEIWEAAAVPASVYAKQV